MARGTFFFRYKTLDTRSKTMETIQIELIQTVTMGFASGANFLLSKEEIIVSKDSYFGLKPLDEVIKLGTHKRTSFEMKPGSFLQYLGILTMSEFNHRQLVFIPEGKLCYYKGIFYYYTFTIVEGTNSLYLQSQSNAGWDLKADKIYLRDGSIIVT